MISLKSNRNITDGQHCKAIRSLLQLQICLVIKKKILNMNIIFFKISLYLECNFVCVGLLCPPENHLQFDIAHVHHANFLRFLKISCSNNHCTEDPIQAHTQNCTLCLKNKSQKNNPKFT